MKPIIYTGAEFVELERLNNSYYGNPRALVRFRTADGQEITGKTATDSQAGYTVDNWRYHKIADVEAHITRAGSVIVDYIRNCRERVPTATPGPCAACRRCRAVWDEPSTWAGLIGYRCELGRKCGELCGDFASEAERRTK